MSLPARQLSKIQEGEETLRFSLEWFQCPWGPISGNWSEHNTKAMGSCSFHTGESRLFFQETLYDARNSRSCNPVLEAPGTGQGNSRLFLKNLLGGKS